MTFCLLSFSAFSALYCLVPPCDKAKKALANLLMSRCNGWLVQWGGATGWLGTWGVGDIGSNGTTG